MELDSEIIGFELRISEINKIVRVFNEKLNSLPEKQMELARLDRDAEIINNNYSYLRQKLEEAKLNIAIQVGDAVILDYARTPSRPIGPNHNRNILLGIIIGLGIGIGICFFYRTFK